MSKTIHNPSSADFTAIERLVLDQKDLQAGRLSCVKAFAIVATCVCGGLAFSGVQAILIAAGLAYVGQKTFSKNFAQPYNGHSEEGSSPTDKYIVSLCRQSAQACCARLGINQPDIIFTDDTYKVGFTGGEAYGMAYDGKLHLNLSLFRDELQNYKQGEKFIKILDYIVAHEIGHTQNDGPRDSRLEFSRRFLMRLAFMNVWDFFIVVGNLANFIPDALQPATKTIKSIIGTQTPLLDYVSMATGWKSAWFDFLTKSAPEIKGLILGTFQVACAAGINIPENSLVKTVELRADIVAAKANGIHSTLDAIFMLNQSDLFIGNRWEDISQIETTHEKYMAVKQLCSDIRRYCRKDFSVPNRPVYPSGWGRIYNLLCLYEKALKLELASTDNHRPRPPQSLAVSVSGIRPPA